MSAPRTTIAVLTYRRPQDLAELLPVLIREGLTISPAARVLVVDNGPDGSAEPLVLEYRDRGVRYAHEPTPGIAAARNHALDAVADDDLLVFIDDDERPTDGWLRLLLSVWERHRCAAVVGPVVSEFEGPMIAWVEAGQFFDRRRMPTGTAVDVAATNNLLLDLSVVRRLGLRFDERFGISGGSDTLFTRQLHSRGGDMVWCDEAVVVDRVPEARMTRRWVLSRALRSGNTWVRVSLEMVPTRPCRVVVRLAAVAAGAGRAVVGAVRLVAGILLHNKRHQARGARTLVRGLGMVTAALGYVYHEYSRSTRETAASS